MGSGKTRITRYLGGTRFFLAEFSSAFACTSLVQSRKTGNCKFDKILCIKFKKKGILIYLYLYIYIFIYFYILRYTLFLYIVIYFFIYIIFHLTEGSGGGGNRDGGSGGGGGGGGRASYRRQR